MKLGVMSGKCFIRTEPSDQYSLAKRYVDAATRGATIEADCAVREAKRHSIDVFLNSLLMSDEVVSEFSPTLWNAAVDHATVSDAGRITFTFRNQMEITIET